MSASHKHHIALVPFEAAIGRLFIVLVVLYFLIRVIVRAVHLDFFDDLSFSGDDFDLLWLAVKDAWLNGLGPIFLFLNALFLAIGFYAMIRAWPMRQKITMFPPPSHGHGAHGAGHAEAAAPPKNPAVLRYWTAIVRKANTGNPENLRSAVLEADALVDFFLKQAGFAGEHMAERLSHLSPESIKSLDRLWEAHKLRNELAHTPGFKLSSKQAEKALLSFRDFLKEMKAF